MAKPTDEQQSAFEDFLTEYRTAEERKEAMDDALVKLKEAMEKRDWNEVVGIGLELIASAGYLEFADSLYLDEAEMKAAKEENAESVEASVGRSREE